MSYRDRVDGPEDTPTTTITYRTAVIVEKADSTASEVLEYLRRVLGENATITGDHDEDGLYFHLVDEIDDVRDEDDAEAAFHALIEGNPYALVMDGFEIDEPYNDEPDWDAIAKDRRIEAEG